MKKIKVLGLTCLGVLMSVPVLATGVENTAVTGAMEQLASDLLVTLGAVAVAAISIFALIIAFRYGKKIFSSVAK